MYLFVVVVLAAVSQIGVLAGPVAFDDVTKDTELLFVFMIHRHGDRTPLDVESIKAYSNNPEALTAAAEHYGYGQLTVPGKQRAYRLGQFIRRRYNSFISPKFNESEIYIESTSLTRTRMTVLTAMSAVYPPLPAEPWSDVVNWEPVPYKSNEAKYDNHHPLNSCPTFEKSFTTKMQSQSIAMKAYTMLIEKISSLMNLENRLKDNPLKIFFLHDLLRSQMHLGIPLSPEVESIFPEIAKAADKAIDVIFNDNSTIHIMSGLLLKEFFDYSRAILNGENTPKIRVYSSHEIYVYGFECILQLLPKQGVPKFAALLSLELRRDANGKVFVLPVYLPTPEEEPKYLQVQGCDSVLCSLDQFTEILSPYTIDVNTWRSKCNWVDTL